MDDITVSENQLPDGVPPKESDFPRPLAPTDDLPPVVVVTYVARQHDGKLVVRGTASDSGQIHRLQVNGHEAHATRGDFADWEVHVAPASSLVIRAQDSSGNTGVSRVDAWD